LALVLGGRWKPRELFVILKAFVDEAGTDGRSPCIVMGGFVGKLSRWNDFDKAWNKQLRRHNMTYFHASEFWGSKGETKGVSFPQKQAISRRFWGAHDRPGRLMFGFSMRVDNNDYQHYKDTLPSRFPRDSQYGLCFRAMLRTTVDTAEQFAGSSDGILMHFVLEDGHKNAGDAVRIFAEAKKHGGKLSEKLGTLTFGEKKRFPGLQAADGIMATSQRLEARNANTFEPIAENATIEDLRTDVIGTPILRAQMDRAAIDDMISALGERKELLHQKWLLDREARRLASSGSEEE
jgi:hypothetical protein